MERSTWKALGWQVLGLGLSIVGLLVFLVVIVGVFLSPPRNSLANLSTDQLPFVLSSIVLIVAGNLISWRFGGARDAVGPHGGGRDPSSVEATLEDLGYEVPADADEDAVVCVECGTVNEVGYTFCANCSAELPS